MKSCVCAAFAWPLLAAALAPAQDKRATAEAVVEKALKALGGADKLGKYKAYIWKSRWESKVRLREHVTTLEVAAQFPDRLRWDTRTESGAGVRNYRRVLEGDKVWDMLDGKVYDTPKGELPREKERLYADWVARIHPLRGKGFRLTLLDEGKVNGKAALGVRVAHAGHGDVLLYFDKETGLPIKRERQFKGYKFGEALIQEVVLYEDYRQAKGIRYPGKVTTFHDGKKAMEFQTVEFRPLEKLDDRLFAKP
jgi:hypothetical protein